jgi:hypothetical protein
MQGASNRLKDWKKSFPECVPKCSHSTKSNHNQSSLPSLGLISRVVKKGD